MKRAVLFLFISFLMLSCSLFDTPFYEKTGDADEGSFYADSFMIPEKGTYTLEFSSDYALDFYCFLNREGMDLFADSGMLYSEALLFPLAYTGTYYEYEDFYVKNDSVFIYYVVDNRDILTPSFGSSGFILKIYK